MNRRPARAALAAGVVLLLGTAVSGCSGDEEAPSSGASSSQPPSASATRQPAPPAIPTKMSIAEVRGKFSGPARKLLPGKIRKAVDTWIDGAYLGEFPRDTWGAAYASFSAGAKQKALTNKGFMSNRDIAGRIDSAIAKQRTVALDVVAANGHAIGVTARVRLVFQTTGELRRTDKVEGRLFLSRDRNDPLVWRVFGYDMTRSEVK